MLHKKNRLYGMICTALLPHSLFFYLIFRPLFFAASRGCRLYCLDCCYFSVLELWMAAASLSRIYTAGIWDILLM